ncbi:MAG: TetR/AcrR family transcriptional regulator [Candidatus Onthomonas sp.]
MAQQKPCQKISVTELCKKAVVNRATFYAHFSDIFGVVAALESDLLHKVAAEVFPEGNDAEMLASKDTMLRMLKCIKEHEQLYRIYLPQLSEARITQALAEYVKKKYAITDDSPDQWEQTYCFEFCKQGTIGILSKWISGGCTESEEDIALWLGSMLKTCFQKGWEDK